MKTKITLILLGAIAVVIFRSQGHQLEKLGQEQRDLKHSLARKASSSNPSEGIRSTKSLSPQKPRPIQVDQVREKLTRSYEIFGQQHLERKLDSDTIREAKELRAELTIAYSKMNHQEMLRIIPPGPYDFDKLFTITNGQVELEMGTAYNAIIDFTRQNPMEAVFLLREIGSQLKSKERLAILRRDAFAKWIRSSPEEAIAWYEQELVEGATDLEDFEAPVLGAKLRKNPEEIIVKINNAEDAKVLEESLSTLQGITKDLADHRRMLPLVNSSVAHHPDAHDIEVYRVNYLSGLNRVLINDYFEDATQFIAENFTPENREQFISDICTDDSLPNPERWASWLVEFGDQKANTRYLAKEWGMKDPEAAVAWLNRQPQSSLKEHLRAEFASQLAKTFPDSERKENILQRIGNR